MGETYKPSEKQTETETEEHHRYHVLPTSVEEFKAMGQSSKVLTGLPGHLQ